MKSRLSTVFAVAALLLGGVVGGLFAKVLSYEVSSTGTACVKKLVAGMNADLVLLDSGMADNFCTGTTCVVKRRSVPIAELIIAESNANQSVALITQLNTNQTIFAGDSVEIKTITF